MTQMLHVVRKDLRRLRWLLALWAVVLIGRVLLRTIVPGLTTGAFESALLLRQLGSVVAALEMVLTALIAARLVHDEPLVGLNAFWLTRPYDRRSLLAAKLLFAGVALIVVPLVADLVTMTSFHAGPAAQWQAWPSLAAGYIRWTAAFLVIAVVTPSTTRFVLGIVGIVSAFALLLALLIAVAVVFVGESTTYRRSLVSDPTAAVVAFVAYAAAALAVITYQYRRRRWRVAIALAVAGLALVVTLAAVWPWSFAGPLEPDPGPWAQDASATRAILDDRAPTQVSQAFSARRRVAPEWYVHGLVRLTGLPAEFGITSVAAQASLVLPSGATLQSEQMASLSQRRVADAPDAPWNPQLVAALGNVRLLASPPGGEYELWPALLTLTDDEYRRHRGEAGRLEALLDVHLTRWREVAALPLAAGATHAERYRRVEIVRLERYADGAVAFVRDWTTRSPLTPDRQGGDEFVLRNRARGEAISATREPWGMSPLGSVSSVGMLPLSFPAADMRGFVLREEALHFPGRRYGAGTGRPRIDADWLMDAELVMVETTYAGRVTRQLTADGFAIPDE